MKRSLYIVYSLCILWSCVIMIALKAYVLIDGAQLAAVIFIHHIFAFNHT
jgi:hypothetical protein